MDDLRDLYQQLILDHNQNPRNFHEPEGANREAHGDNPLCGDEINLFIKLEDDVIRDIGFLGSGCAISKASASIMTTVLKGKTRAEALALLDRFHRMATTGEVDAEQLGKLAALADVHKYPVRVKCAMLPWRTMEASLEERQGIISTE
ncbi:MAG: Fe-S cluster assembly sulfur transfer protein SufU [Candidatus Neomarinimicrobiota bacterium]